jgi:hypothetical protein
VTLAQMTRYLGDGRSYAPVTILIEETPDATRMAPRPCLQCVGDLPGRRGRDANSAGARRRGFALFKRATAA